MVTILQSPFFVELVLPFLLVFAVVFAVLQKSQILGNGKKQVDSIVALAVALIVLAFAGAVNIINQMTAFLAVAIVIVLVLMLLFGMVSPPGKFDELFSKFKGTVGLVLFLAVLVAVLYITGSWDYLLELYRENESSAWISNIVLIVAVVGGIWFAMRGGSGESSSGGSKGSS